MKFSLVVVLLAIDHFLGVCIVVHFCRSSIASLPFLVQLQRQLTDLASLKFLALCYSSFLFPSATVPLVASTSQFPTMIYLSLFSNCYPSITSIFTEAEFYPLH